LLIGFEQQNNAAANDYVVDLGSVTQFIDATSPLTFNLSSSDLSSTFGSSWASNTQTNLVQWSVIGASNKTTGGDLTLGSITLPANTLFYTVGESTPGVQSTPPTEHTTAIQNGFNGNIANFDTGTGGFSGTATTSGSTGSLQAINQTHGASNSYSYEIASKGNFGIGGNSQQPTTGSATGPTDSVLDLYEVTPTNADVTQPTTYLGDFTLNSSGVLTFTEAAPEPSSYALLMMGMGLLFILQRRRVVR
jgi:hypothetical protein